VLLDLLRTVLGRVFPVFIDEISEHGGDHEIDSVLHGGSPQTRFEDAIIGLPGYNRIKA
jgi:hypothetical protein